MYSNGVSEEMIGRCIKKHNLPRHKLVLLSKCYGTVGEEPDVLHIRYPNEIKRSKDYVNQGGLSRTAIFNAVNKSLERLQTDYMDLLQIHRFDATVPIEETMKALHDLVESGKVRYIGKSGLIGSETWLTSLRCQLDVGISVPAHAERCQRAQLDTIRQHAEPLQSLLP